MNIDLIKEQEQIIHGHICKMILLNNNGGIDHEGINKCSYINSINELYDALVAISNEVMPEEPIDNNIKIIFDAKAQQWSGVPDYNKIYLGSLQRYANDRLETRGHIFLNEIYDDLGLPRTQEGTVMGWIKDGLEESKYIDFHISDIGDNNFELKFETDGIIADKLS